MLTVPTCAYVQKQVPLSNFKTNWSMVMKFDIIVLTELKHNGMKNQDILVYIATH